MVYECKNPVLKLHMQYPPALKRLWRWISWLWLILVISAKRVLL